MTGLLKNVAGKILLLAGVALAWCGLVALNDVVFEQMIVTPYAALIYLPAALRVIFPLVLGNIGYLGIILGSFWMAQDKVNNGLADTALLAIASGLAPFIGIYVSKSVFKTRPDLSDLKPAHLLALAVLCAASNALLLEFYFLLSGGPMPPLSNLLIIFIGDTSWALILLYLASLALTFFISRRRV